VAWGRYCSPVMKARTQHDSATAVTDCCHHWVLGAPQDGAIKAICRKCGGERVYPAVLDDLDPKAEPEKGQQPGVATAVGGARPSSVAVPLVKAKPRLPSGKQS
jgi:hypothetical protein